MKHLFTLVALCLLYVFTLSAQTTVYSNIPNPLPGNVPSEGPEAYFFSELGAGITIQPSAIGATIHKASVVMSSWACQQGNWYNGGCATESNATFAQPITLNIYSANGNTPVALLGSVTTTFDIPYRPSSTPNLCGGGTQWYSKADNKCYNGLATVITFELTSLHIALPQEVILTVAYNTSDAGPHPLGALPCRSTTAGCPYDSLNIGLGASFGDPFVNTQIGSPTIAGLTFVPAAQADGCYPQIELLALPNNGNKTASNQ